MVITLNNLPAEIEEALQRKAAAEGKTLDEVTIDALRSGLRSSGKPILTASEGSANRLKVSEIQSALEDAAKAEQLDVEKRIATYRHSSDISTLSHDEQLRKATLQAGAKRDLSFLTGSWVEDPQFDAIVKEQRQIDPELWQ